ncbi:hypothetical protein PMAYCL1PPCAC_01404, partial [Pristionchus mayeri]
FPGAKNCEPLSELMFGKCDILIPAACENSTHTGNSGKVQAMFAQVVAEAAINPADEKFLLTRGNCLIIPDMCANSGGVTVSFFDLPVNRNLASHGRLTFKYERDTNEHLLKSVEDSISKSLNQKV